MEKLITILKAELVIDRLFWVNRDNSLRSNIVELDVSIEKDAANSQTAFIEESLQKLRKDGMNFKHNISRRSGEADNIGTNQTVDLRISITNID
ncbi:MAG: hypothetical protein EB127_06525 [Alphaproteobacteria bacterium]|nr:hypothetical protein [Alphaproteobacteria bacterium]